MRKLPISINDVCEIRSRSTVYLGVGAIDKMGDIAKELAGRGITKLVAVTGKKSYETTGAWGAVQKAFKEAGLESVLYNGITPNPTADQVDEATAAGREFGAQAVIAIGGGSPIDAGKSVAILLEYPDRDARDLYGYKFTPDKAVPIIAVNTTHGTGTEIDRFAVVSIPELNHKPAIAYDCIYPLYSIDDPALITDLPEDQTRFVTIDAVNHVVEAATTVAASPYSILLAQETVELIAEYLPKVLADPKDLEVRYYLLYASMIAGISFDNGLLHFTHAMEHPLSAVKPELAHGLGLAMLLPAIVRTIYPERPEVLATVLSPIVDGLKGNASEAEAAAKGVEQWLFSVGVKSKLADVGFVEGDIDKLTDLAFNTPSLG
ncbi:MAG: iron-containing alcohol dehydrogenase, partial [Planctomycetota bacterium]